MRDYIANLYDLKRQLTDAGYQVSTIMYGTQAKFSSFVSTATSRCLISEIDVKQLRDCSFAKIFFEQQIHLLVSKIVEYLLSMGKMHTKR